MDLQGGLRSQKLGEPCSEAGSACFGCVSFDQAPEMSGPDTGTPRADAHPPLVSHRLSGAVYVYGRKSQRPSLQGFLRVRFLSVLTRYKRRGTYARCIVDVSGDQVSKAGVK